MIYIHPKTGPVIETKHFFLQNPKITEIKKMLPSHFRGGWYARHKISPRPWLEQQAVEPEPQKDAVTLQGKAVSTLSHRAAPEALPEPLALASKTEEENNLRLENNDNIHKCVAKVLTKLMAVSRPRRAADAVSNSAPDEPPQETQEQEKYHPIPFIPYHGISSAPNLWRYRPAPSKRGVLAPWKALLDSLVEPPPAQALQTLDLPAASVTDAGSQMYNPRMVRSKAFYSLPWRTGIFTPRLA